jgi:hypothetical protein
MDDFSRIRAANDAFCSGFNHAKDKILEHVDSALSVLQSALKNTETEIPSDANKEIRIRMLELRRIRAAITAVKPEIAGR